MLSADEATDIAIAHGLGVEQAASLQSLAEDRPTAERIARRFADAADATFARDLLGAPEPVDLDAVTDNPSLIFGQPED